MRVGSSYSLSGPSIIDHFYSLFDPLFGFGATVVHTVSLIHCCAAADGQLLRGARHPDGQADVWRQVEDTSSLLSPVQHHQHHCSHTSV